MGVPRYAIKMHLAAFCATTPIAALTANALLDFFGVNNDNDWIGTALLLSVSYFPPDSS